VGVGHEYKKKKSLRSNGLPTCIKKAAEGSIYLPLRRVVVAVKNIKSASTQSHTYGPKIHTVPRFLC
jgi:hypothetical protein